MKTYSARFMYSPVSVETTMRTPALMKGGIMTRMPLLARAGL